MDLIGFITKKRKSKFHLFTKHFLKKFGCKQKKIGIQDILTFLVTGPFSCS